MSISSLQQLRNLADTDPVLQVALAGTRTVSEIQAIASQYSIHLDDVEANQWLDDAAPDSPTLSSEELAAISEGLSLTDNDLETIAGGAGVGEAAYEYAGDIAVTEAL